MTSYYICKAAPTSYGEDGEILMSIAWDCTEDDARDEARSLARGMIRSKGTEVAWYVYGPFEFDDSWESSVSVGTL